MTSTLVAMLLCGWPSRSRAGPRPHAHDDLLAHVAAQRLGHLGSQLQLEAGLVRDQLAALVAQGDLQEVHRGRPDEAGHEPG